MNLIESELAARDDAAARAGYRAHCDRVMARIAELPPSYRTKRRSVVDRMETMAAFYTAHADTLTSNQLFAVWILLEPQLWELEQATGVVEDHRRRPLEIVR